MIPWLFFAQAIVTAVIGLAVLIAGIAKVKMNDWILGGAALSILMLLALAVASIVAPLAGAGPTGDIVEYWVYLISALFLPVAAGVWALVQRDRWGVVALGVAILAVAVMVYRMHQIWFVQVV